MASLRMRQAVLQALDDALSEDETVVLLGEDIAVAGGPFKCTDGLLKKYGVDRVIDTPISEMGFMGAAVGAGGFDKITSTDGDPRILQFGIKAVV